MDTQNQNEVIYWLWTVTDDCEVEGFPLVDAVHRNLRSKNYLRFHDHKGNLRTMPLSDLEMYRHNRVLSIHSDKNYIVELIRKQMFANMMDAQIKYMTRNEKFIKFREVNG